MSTDMSTPLTPMTVLTSVFTQWLLYEAGRHGDLDLSALTAEANYAAAPPRDPAASWWQRAAAHARRGASSTAQGGPSTPAAATSAQSEYFALTTAGSLLGIVRSPQGMGVSLSLSRSAWRSREAVARLHAVVYLQHELVAAARRSRGRGRRHPEVEVAVVV